MYPELRDFIKLVLHQNEKCALLYVHKELNLHLASKLPIIAFYEEEVKCRT